MIADSNTDAYQEVAAQVRTVCTGSAMVTLLGAELPLQYQQVQQGGPTKNSPFVRLTVVNSREKKRTLSVPSRVTKVGVVDMQLCIPITTRKAAELGSRAADLLQTAVQRRTDSVSFFQSFTRPMPQGEGFFIWRISANINYDIMEGVTI